jgi:glyceraldehyde-3-phosphate dehydrogenase/erythrose-4-phosphate dehydrogenase
VAIRVGINGFGRIGRLVFRVMAARPNEFEVVAINDLTDTKTLATLLKYDSTHRRFNGTVEHDATAIKVNGKRIEILKERDPAKLPSSKARAFSPRERTRQRARLATTPTLKQARKKSCSAPRPRTSPT